MRGHMRQKKAGTWEPIVELGRDPLTNRRKQRSKQRSKTFHGPKREAERQLRALIADVETGRLTDSATTVTDIVQKRIDLIADRRAPSTMREHRRILRERVGPRSVRSH